MSLVAKEAKYLLGAIQVSQLVCLNYLNAHQVLMVILLPDIRELSGVRVVVDSSHKSTLGKTRDLRRRA